MYCIQCGVKLADTEKTCPLCHTVVYHPDLQPTEARPMYPANKMPKSHSTAKVLSGAAIILFFIPLLICAFADLRFDGEMDWFGYVAGAAIVAYVAVALPLWFKKPNPVIFVPCSFAAAALYLLYVSFATGGHWYFNFALPVTGAACLITCTVVTLLRYLRGGRWYIFGGGAMGLGAFTLLVEYLTGVAFGLPFVGWSVYPLVVLMMFGGFLMYLAMNKTVRETLERKLFF